MTQLPRFAHVSVRKYLLWLAFGCLLPGVIGAALIFSYEYRQGRLNQQSETTRTARALVHAVDGHLLRGQTLAQTLATAESLRERDFESFHIRARAALQEAGIGVSVVLRDKLGRQLVNTAIEYGEPPPTELRASAQIVFNTGKPAVSELFNGPTLKTPLLSVDVPVVIDGEVIYALAVGISPDRFNAIMQAPELPPNWVAAVLDASGTIVGRNRDAEHFIGNRATRDLLEPVRRAREGSIQATTQEGTQVSTFFSRSPVTNWSVAIGIPTAELESALTRQVGWLALAATALFALGLLLAWLIGGRIARAVASLTASAEALGQGAAQLPASATHTRETAEVASAMARAAVLLRQRADAVKTGAAELMEAHRLGRFGTWHWDFASGEVTTSASVPEIYGRPVPPFAEQRGTLLPVDSWERVNAASRTVLAGSNGYDLELQVNHGSGRTIWVQSKCEPVRNDNNEVIGLRGTIQDITERKNQEQALRDSERRALEAASRAHDERHRLNAILEATPVGIFVADADGAILDSNVAAKDMWGHNHPQPENAADYGEWRGWWADGGTRHGLPLGVEDWPMARALSGAPVSNAVIEIESFDAAKTHRIVLMSAAPVRDDAGTIIGGVLTQMDITDRMRAEEALRESGRRKDEFLAMLSHELRNPLAPIAAAADLLGMGRLDEPRVRDTSKIIGRQVRHMTGLIDDLLDVSRVTRGLVKLERRALDVRRVVSEAIEQVRPTLDAREQHLTVSTPEAAATVLGDHKRLVQIVANLLNNAAKFTPPAGRIAVDVACDGRYVEIIVSDNGIGMTPDLTERAFELFAQGERTADRSLGGLGIGLALVKSLVELHGGNAAAQSAGTGKGSTFTVRLPVITPAETPAHPGHAASTSQAPEVASDSLKVLIVDDNADAAQMLAMVVEGMGHHTVVEHGARQAVERARDEVPDVCLLDIGLPDMDGRELARRLRSDPRTAHALLVAVTGYGQEHDRSSALNAGFDQHFVKPVDSEALAKLLAGAASGTA